MGSYLFRDRVPDMDSIVVEAGQGRRGHRVGQDQHARVRPVRHHREQGGRSLPQSLEHQPLSRRFQRWSRCGSCRRTVHYCHRQRRRRIHSHPGQLQRCIRHKAHPASRPALRWLRTPRRQPLFPVGPHEPYRGRHRPAVAGAAGPDSRDPNSIRETPPDFSAGLDRGVEGMRIAWSPDFGYAGVDPEVAEITARAARVFEEMGAIVEDAPLQLEDPFDSFFDVFATATLRPMGTCWRSTATIFRPRPCIPLITRPCGRCPGSPAIAHVDRLGRQMEDFFDTYDLLLSPTMATPGPRNRYETLGHRRQGGRSPVGIPPVYLPDQHDRTDCIQRSVWLLFRWAAHRSAHHRLAPLRGQGTPGIGGLRARPSLGR